MKNVRRMKWGLFFAILLVCGAVSAAIEIPKASGKALGITRGKPFKAGLVFVDGRYIEPPYVVERWGVGIRINGIPVVGQVVDWSEFLKTQEGVKITKTESAPVSAAEPEPAAEAEPEEAEEVDDSESSLDDLFDDEPKPKKTSAKKAPKKIVRKPKSPKPTTTVSYALEGAFVANDASNALLAKINKMRTDINATLLAGGFICFGSNYARISGNARIAVQILEKLPDIEKSSLSEEALVAAVRSAYLVCLTEPVCKDLYRNRIDYLKLQARREKAREEQAFKKLVDELGNKPRY